MAPLTTLLDEALELWEGTRTGVIEELKNIPDKDMTFAPSETRSRETGPPTGAKTVVA